MVFTIIWFMLVFIHHKVLDWNAIWNGRLRYTASGYASCYEPMNIALIYGFEMELIQMDRVETELTHMDDSTPKSEVWNGAFPGFAAIGLIANFVMLRISMLPNSSAIFYFCGCGGFLSIKGLAIASVVMTTMGFILFVL